MYGKLLRDEVQEKAVRGPGTVWRARVTWSKGTLTWDWSFTDLTSVQNRSMCTAEKYSQGQLLRDVWGWTRHKKEKKRKSWRWNGVPDELSRSGELEETQHVDEIMKMYGGVFLYSNPLGSYEQSKFSRLIAKLKIVHNFSMDLNREKSHRTSSLFHP